MIKKFHLTQVVLKMINMQLIKQLWQILFNLFVWGIEQNGYCKNSIQYLGVYEL